MNAQNLYLAMTDLREELFEVIDRRQSDIALAKRSICLARTEAQRSLLFRACTLLIYAALEGGCKEMTSCLLSRVAKTRPNISDLATPFLFLAIKRSCRIGEAVLDLQKRHKLAEEVREAVSGPVKMPGSINIESNLTPKTLMRMCQSLMIKYPLDNAGEQELNLLLRYRNNIAHGDQNMPIDMMRIDQFSHIAQFILVEVASEVSDCSVNAYWRR
ncbi:hypothetical protein KQ301_04730 [Synechococcus sp. CS-601]|nr:hypothetical protein [Synechococcus sp. CS-601]